MEKSRRDNPCEQSLASDDEKLTTLLGDTHQPRETEKKDSPQTKLYKRLMSTVMCFVAMRKRRRSELLEESAKSTRVGAAY